jgi:hypothetical protein
MMQNIQRRQKEIIEIIKTKINCIDENYRSLKSLNIYKTVLQNRKDTKNVKEYLLNENYISDIRKILEAWGMNKRRAKLRELSEIKQSFADNINCFVELEKLGADILTIDIEKTKPILECLYNSLRIMKSKSRLVSFSKTLHFVFPDLCMPMDRTNTLDYFYNNTSESFNKYYEIFEFSSAIAREGIEWNNIIGKGEWNTTIPKIIDNAIILKRLALHNRLKEPEK